MPQLQNSGTMVLEDILSIWSYWEKILMSVGFFSQFKPVIDGMFDKYLNHTNIS